MDNQTTLNFVHQRENNRTSQKILDDNQTRLSGQVKTVLRLFVEKDYLTVRDAMIDHNISHLPRRAKDIRDNKIWDIKINTNYLPSGVAIYWLDKENKVKATEILNKIK